MGQRRFQALGLSSFFGGKVYGRIMPRDHILMRTTTEGVSGCPVLHFPKVRVKSTHLIPGALDISECLFYDAKVAGRKPISPNHP